MSDDKRETPSTWYCPRCLNTFEGERETCANLQCGRARPRDGWGRIHDPGEIFDRNYKLHRMLALGGAGVTYVARELGPGGKEVGPELAIKVLLAARDQGPYVRRLANEAHIIQELDHPNIVQYLGFVHRAGHSPYLITRFEKGGSLLDYMRRVGMLSIRRAAGVARQICWALEKAHERGIVHRDLKPENVVLTRPFGPSEEPVIRVADFGIAKVQGSLGSNLTRVGAFVGTPLYAAPEQFIGATITRSADVYGAGALVHFLLTGRHVVKFADRLDPADTFQLLVDNLPPRIDLAHEDIEDVRRINRILSVSMAAEPSQRCTVVQLDEMLGAMLAGRDPSIPEPVREVDTGPLPPAGSVVGMAGALDGLEVTALPRDAADEAESTWTSDVPAELSEGGEGTIDEPQRTLSLDPDTVEEAIGAKKKGGGGGRLVFVLLVLLVVGALGSAAVAGAVVYLRPDLVGLGGEAPVDISANDSDLNRRQEYDVIHKRLLGLQGWLDEVCSPGSGHTVELELVVDEDGRVRKARAVDAHPDATDRCLAEKVQRAEFTRVGEGAVRARVELEW